MAMSFPLQALLFNHGLYLTTLPPGIPVASRTDCVSRCFLDPVCEHVYYDRPARLCHMKLSVDSDDESSPSSSTARSYPDMESVQLKIEGCGDGYTWSGSASLCYKLHQTRRSWDSAQAQCQKEGGRLIKVDTDVKNLLMNKVSDALEKNLWTGGRHDGDAWKWEDGSTINNSYWTVKPLDIVPLDRCIHINTFNLLHDPFNKWSQDLCTYAMYHVCEIPILSQQCGSKTLLGFNF